MWGGLPSTAELGYPTSACIATSEKFSRQDAVKSTLDSFRALASRSRAKGSGATRVPRTPDRERESGVLDVHEQRAPIGRKTCAGELAFPGMRIARDAIAPTLWRHTDNEVLAFREIVLTYDEVAPRRGADVIGAVEQRVIVGLHHERQPLLPQVDAEHLAEFARAAAGTTHVDA